MKKAFTLTELLVVIIFVGILASLAIPRFGKSTDKAMETEAKLALLQVQELQRIYFLEHKRYATDVNAIDFEQEPTVAEDPEKGTARYRIMIDSADDQDFLAVAEPVVNGLNGYTITKQGKAQRR
jgi:type IV pilus assembly protein PilE